MNIVVDAANIPQMPSGTNYNQGAADRSHYCCKYFIQSGMEIYSVDVRMLRHTITFTCQSVKPLNLEKKIRQKSQTVLITECLKITSH